MLSKINTSNLPNMSDTLIDWLQPVKLKTVTTTTIDFEPVEHVDVLDIDMVVQVADKNKLNFDSLNWSREYIMFHVPDHIVELGEYIEWNGRDYKVFSREQYQDYGFNTGYAEETARPLLEAT